MLTLPEDLRKAVRSAGSQLIRVVDPETGEEYVLLPAQAFDHLTADDGPTLTRQEQLGLLAAAGRRAGWDDPEMDVYNELDPRRP